mgnify:CR=1 FL=1
MKKHFGLVLMLLPRLVGCGGKTSTNSGTAQPGQKDTTPTVTDPFVLGQSRTDAELLAKAKTETGKFKAYGNSSRIADAVKNFIKKYPELNLSDSTSTGSKRSDSEIYTKLTSEYSSKNNSEGASFALIQDSARLDTYRSNSQILTNYVNDSFKSNLDEGDLVPLVDQYINKLFIWNNLAGDAAPKITNVWELTEAKFKGKVFFKNPNSEMVNRNFLIMLTQETWVTKRTKAYKDYFKKDYVKSSTYKSASYEWIAKFLANADVKSYTSDTKRAAGVAKEENKDKMGLFVLSKLRDSSVASENLTVGAWETNAIAPFSGFGYCLYSQIATKAPRPYTAMLFTNYRMTAEGFKPWGDSIGCYSSNKSIAQNKDDKKDLAFYKSNLVRENGAYINTVKVETEDWINKLIGNAQ